MEEKSLEKLLEALDKTDISYFSLCQDGKGKKRKKIEIFRKKSKQKEEGESQLKLERSEKIQSFQKEPLKKQKEEERQTFDIFSPHVGFFFRAETEEGQPLVKLREVVSRGTVLAYIRSMSISYEVLASNEGKIVEILVETGQAVEFGQPLFRLRKM